MTLGKTSLDDWPWLTSSLGWIGCFEPSAPPASWLARLGSPRWRSCSSACRNRFEMQSRELVVEPSLDHVWERVRSDRPCPARAVPGRCWRAQRTSSRCRAADDRPAPPEVIHPDAEVLQRALVWAPTGVRREPPTGPSASFSMRVFGGWGVIGASMEGWVVDVYQRSPPCTCLSCDSALLCRGAPKFDAPRTAVPVPRTRSRKAAEAVVPHLLVRVARGRPPGHARALPRPRPGNGYGSGKGSGHG